MGSKSRPRRIHRTAMIFGRELLRGHSAHINREVEVHYRWHALHGRKVRQHYALTAIWKRGRRR
jgi:hypothetical protein